MRTVLALMTLAMAVMVMGCGEATTTESTDAASSGAATASCDCCKDCDKCDKCDNGEKCDCTCLLYTSPSPRD